MIRSTLKKEMKRKILPDFILPKMQKKWKSIGKYGPLSVYSWSFLGSFRRSERETIVQPVRFRYNGRNEGGERLESHGSGGAIGHVSAVISIGVRENEGEAPIFFRQCVRLKQWAFDDVIVPSS